MYPRLGLYTFHILHVHPSGFHNFLFLLNSLRLGTSIIFCGTSSQVLGPRYSNVSEPYYVVRMFSVLNTGLFQRLQVLSMLGNMECIKLGEVIFYFMHLTNFFRFLSCMEKELSGRNSRANDESSSLYTSHNALSCKLFILLLSIRL